MATGANLLQCSCV